MTDYDLIAQVAEIISKKENLSFEKAKIMFLTSKTYEYLVLSNDNKYPASKLYNCFQDEIKHGFDDIDEEADSTFTEKQTCELAKTISEVENKSVDEAKLEVKQLPFMTFWPSLTRLIADFNPKTSFRLYYLYKLIDFGGYTEYKNEFSPEIKTQEKEWVKWIDTHVNEVNQKSINIDTVLKESFPLIFKANRDAELINKEKDDENRQLISELIDWLKKNSKAQVIMLKWLKFSSDQWNSWKVMDDTEFNLENENMAKILYSLYLALKNQNWDQFEHYLWKLEY